MIPNNPSGPEGDIPSKERDSFDENAVKKLEELGLSNKVSQDLAKLKAEMSDIERNKKITLAVEKEFPGGDNSERIESAISTLKESKSRIAHSLSEQSKAERISLAKNITSSESLDSDPQGTLVETTDGLKAFALYSIPVFVKTVGKFFTDIPAALRDIRASIEYLLAKADGKYKEPETTTTTFNT